MKEYLVAYTVISNQGQYTSRAFKSLAHFDEIVTKNTILKWEGEIYQTYQNEVSLKVRSIKVSSFQLL